MDLLGDYSDSDDDGVAKEVPETTETASAAAPIMTKAEKKQRKLLSLANVLPPNILEQLQRSEVQGDDDDEVAAPRSKSSLTSYTGAEDAGISSLLFDLKSHQPGSGRVMLQSKKAKKASGANEAITSTILGEDLLQSTVTIVPSTKSAPQASKKEVAPRKTRTTAYRPLFLPGQGIDKSAPSPASKLSTNNNGAQLSVKACHPAGDSVPADVPSAAAYSAQPAPQAAPPARARRRQDIERELRQGNLSVVDDYATSVQQDAPYEVDEQTFAVPRNGIRVAPTAMYDPSKGEAVTDHAGKGKGKNQINYLLQQASSLEVARARGLAQTQSKTQRANSKQKYGW